MNYFANVKKVYDAMMNPRTIIVMLACLTSLASLGQESIDDTSLHSPYVHIKRETTAIRNHNPPSFETLITNELESVPIAMHLDHWECMLMLATGNRATFIRLSCTINESLSLDDKSKVVFLLQDGSTVAGMSTGFQESTRHLGPGYPYTYNFMFKMDTNQIRKLAKTNIKSGRLYIPRGSFSFRGRLCQNPDIDYCTLNALDDNETDKIRKTAGDFLNQYIKNLYESTVITKH
jgi:hypothetical protein